MKAKMKMKMKLRITSTCESSVRGVGTLCACATSHL
jgi:hypothetical protein